jgi:CubicO group peptidase (beta-lactamase class C family)
MGGTLARVCGYDAEPTVDACGRGGETVVGDELAVLAEIDDLVREQMAAWEVPGLSVGILHEGNVETAGYGVASIETNQPVVPETLFQIGSISKVFTATLVMTLVDEGQLDLDAPVIGYVPDLPLADETARKTITVRHLLTHMSGFYGDRFDDQGVGDDALAKAVAAFGDLKQQTAPGELWTYCNAGFDLAGRTVELILGQPFEQAMRERVFKQLGLERSTYFAAEAIRHSVAVGHTKLPDEDQRVADPWPIPRRSNPAGGISSNVGELLRFARAHMQDGELDGTRVISAESARAMRTVQTQGDYPRFWGLGWSLREADGLQIAEHNGGTNGFMTRLTTVPERQFAVAVFTNGDHGSAAHGKIGDMILERMLGITSESPTRITLDDAALARFARKYRHDLADLTFTVEDGGYRVDRVSRNPFSGEEMVREPFRLVPVTERIFVVDGGEFDGAYAEMILNEDGGVRFLRFGGRLAYPV